MFGKDSPSISMRGGSFSAVSTAGIAGSLFLVLFCVLPSYGTLWAHGDHGGPFNPPMKPPPFNPGTGSGGGSGNGLNVSRGRGQTITVPGTRLRGPGGAVTPSSSPKGAGTGGLARKVRGATTSTVSWEHWWARNRFLYLNFPGLEGHVRRRPLTPNAGETEARLEALRERLLETARSFLDHDSARLRRAAVLSLGRLHDPGSLAAMEARLRDGNQTVRDAAVMALGLSDARAAKFLLMHIARGTKEAAQRLSESKVPDYFRGFAQVFLALKRAKGLPAVLRAIAVAPEENPEVRAAAVESLGLFGGEEAALFLTGFMDRARRTTPGLMAALVTALGRTGEAAVLPFLDRCLDAREAAVRRAAAVAVARLAPRDNRAMARHLVLCCKGTGDSVFQGFARVALGIVGGEEALAFLDRAVTHGDVGVQPWACLGLGFALRGRDDARAAEAAQHLLAVLEKAGNRSTRSAAAVGLGLAQRTEVLERIGAVLEKGDDPYLRGYCAMALGMLKDGRAVPLLESALGRDDVSAVRTRVVLALAMLDATRIAPSLVDYLIETRNEADKIFIALALQYMGDPRVVERILDALERGGLDDITAARCLLVASKILAGEREPVLLPLAAGSDFVEEYPFFRYLLDSGV